MNCNNFMTKENIKNINNLNDIKISTFFCGIKKTSNKEDDLLLMSMAKNTGCHVGIYLGEQMVLHHQVGRLSSRDLLDSQMQKSIYKRYRHVEKN